MKKIILLISITVYALSGAFTQNQVDALRYSQQFYGSSAKSAAMGGSLNAVGADLSVLATNPAGMAVFKKGFFQGTPNFFLTSSTSVLNGNTRTTPDYNFTISDFGFVGVWNRPSGLWKQFSLGFAYNRFNEYTSSIKMFNNNLTGSVLDYYVYNANSIKPGGAQDIYRDRWSNFREGLAGNTDLLFYDEDLDEFYTHVTDKKKYGEDQRKEISQTGGGGEFDLSVAANFQDMLYIGGTIGIKSYNYNLKSVYTEDNFTDIYAQSAINPNDSVQVDPNSIKHVQTLNTQGGGFDFKFGIIFQPLNFIRVSAAVNSMGFLTFTDTYETSMETVFPVADANDDFSKFESSDPNIFDWKLESPMRANAGIAFILPSYKLGGFFTIPMTFSLGYEFVDYSRMNMRALNIETYSFDHENEYISENYTQTHNFNAGLELNFGLLKLRGGYAFYSSPFASAVDIMDGAIMSYSGGIGFADRTNTAFLDLAYVYNSSVGKDYLYNAGNDFPVNPIGAMVEPTSNLTFDSHYFKVTLGLKF